MFQIRYATEQDKDFWFTLDHNLKKEDYMYKVRDNQAYIMLDDEKPIGVLRYNYMWDQFPFLNQIYIDWDYHMRGFGRKAMEFWEKEMREKGAPILLVSTQVNEASQHFYRKLGFKDCGCMVFDIPGLEQPLEMFMVKVLN